MDTLLNTKWDAGLVALVEAWTALETLPVFDPHHLAVHCPVDHRGLWAAVGALPGPLTGLGGQLAEGARLRLLGNGGIALPDVAGVGVIGFEAYIQPEAQGQEQEEVQEQRRHHP